MKRKVKSGLIELHNSESAIVVNYEVEATVLGDHGEAMQVERKQHQKLIKLSSLNDNTDIPRLTGQIIEKCKMIHTSKRGHVEDLLRELRDRHRQREGGADSYKREVRKAKRRERAESRGSSGRDRTGSGRRDGDGESKHDDERGSESKAGDRGEGRPKAAIEDLDSYLEMLYEEDDRSKARATTCVLELARNTCNLETMIQNDALMGALSRTLGEEYRRPEAEIAVHNIMRTFFSFSVFSQMHPLLSQYRVGALTIKVLEFEVKRAEFRAAEEAKWAADLKSLDQQQKGMDDQGADNDAEVEGEEEGKDDSGDRRRRRDRDARRQEKVAVKREKIDRRRARNKKQASKSDKLAYVCISMLLHLAEDANVERKMAKKGLVASLASFLTRLSPELLSLTTTFLRKLSVTAENAAALAKPDLMIVPRLARFVTCSDDGLIRCTLRLLFNMSFLPACREQIVKANLVPKLVQLLAQRAPFRAITLRLLYHLSCDDRCRQAFVFTNAIQVIVQLVINFPQSAVAKELVGLTINLSLHPRNAMLMCRQQSHKLLASRSLKTRDTLLFKVLRNLSGFTLAVHAAHAAAQHDLRIARTNGDTGEDETGASAPVQSGRKGQRARQGSSVRDRARAARERSRALRGLWSPWVPPMLELLQRSDDHDLMVELLGTLANLTPLDVAPSHKRGGDEGKTGDDFDEKDDDDEEEDGAGAAGEGAWEAVLEQNTVLPYLQRLLQPGFLQDDIVLEVINLVGAIALDAASARMLATSRLPSALCDLLREKTDDPTIMVQVLVALQRMLLHRDTFNHLVYTLNVVDDIIELLGDPLGLAPSPNKASGAGSTATAEEQAAQQAHNVLRAEANKVLDVIMDCDMSASTPEGEDGDDVDAYGDGGEGKATDARQGRAQMGGGSRVADMTLGKFARQVRSQRFRTHNREWLDAIEHDLAAEAEGEAEERAFLREQRRRTAEAEGRSLSDEEDDEFDEQDNDWEYVLSRTFVYRSLSGVGRRYGNVEMDMGQLHDEGDDDEFDGDSEDMDGLGGSLDEAPGQWEHEHDGEDNSPYY
eukprot:g2945.t1